MSMFKDKFNLLNIMAHVENFRSSYDLPVARKRRVAINRSSGPIAALIGASCNVRPYLTKLNKSSYVSISIFK